MQPSTALKAAGLSDKEIKVYLSCLGMGSSTVNQISKKSGTFRTYTYDLLKSLMDAGLISCTRKGGRQFFEASAPERLIEIVKEKEYQLNQALPELRLMKQTLSKKPSVLFYEGQSGLRLVHDMVLREKPYEIRVYGNPQKHYEIMKFYLPRFVAERVKFKIKARVIIKDSKVGREWMEGKEKGELRETRFFPLQPGDFPAVTYMWSDKIAYFTIDKNIMAVIIEDESIAKAQKSVFENLWAYSQKR